MKDGRIIETPVRGTAQGAKANIYNLADGEHITHIDLEHVGGDFRFIRIFTSNDTYSLGDKKYLKPFKNDVSTREVRALAGRYNNNKLECLFFYYTL